MSMLHEFEPRNRTVDVKRIAPLTRSMEKFFVCAELPGGETPHSDGCLKGA